jgi:hypothetical protein
LDADTFLLGGARTLSASLGFAALGGGTSEDAAAAEWGME